MNKYLILLNILDTLIKEADVAYSVKYNPLETDPEKINLARSRAFIHLFLKVSFGILDFKDREYYLTDGTYDGGVDGYYINSENKSIYFIQSKFRTTQRNFEQKEITLEEILIMDINRIVEGEELDEAGNKYNGKIRQLQNDIRNLADIARYKYHVVLLANLNGILPSKLRYLTGGYPAEVLNYETCYERLVFPVISGTYFNATDLNIQIDLSNKNAGSKISYTVQTKKNECEITVLFVPTIEIAKILQKYKNSILKYNPRSYLELEGQKVNTAIRQTILEVSTNEFALYNNGITLISDETHINEKIGQKNKAQLTVKNPQIINGGQTSYTLSKIFESNKISADKLFENKEVLLKVITLVNNSGIEEANVDKIQLIEDISTATNQQTPVNTADRYSNEPLHVKIQRIIFERYGLLYERKRGEFGDGVNSGYINEQQIIERNLFFKIYYATNGNINKAVEKKLFLKQQFTEKDLTATEELDNFYFGFLCFRRLHTSSYYNQRIEKNIYGMVYAMTKRFKTGDTSQYDLIVQEKLDQFKDEWNVFVRAMSIAAINFRKTFIDKDSKKVIGFFSESKWYKSYLFERDVIDYFQNYNATSDPVSQVIQIIFMESDIPELKTPAIRKVEKNRRKLDNTIQYLKGLKFDRNELNMKLFQAITNEQKKEYADNLLENSRQILKAEERISRMERIGMELQSELDNIGGN